MRSVDRVASDLYKGIDVLMERPHDLCRKVYAYTGNRDIAIRAIRECFGLDPGKAELVMWQVEGTVTPPADEGERLVDTYGQRFVIWGGQGVVGLLSGTIGFIGSGCFFRETLTTNESSMLLNLLLAILISGFSGGLARWIAGKGRPASLGTWAGGVLLISIGLTVLSIASFPAVAFVYSALRHVNLVEPPPETSDLIGVLESFALLALCVAAAAPLSSELAVRMRSSEKSP